VDLEVHDAAVRAAIAGGRLASLRPAILGRFTESSVLTVIPGRARVPYDPPSQFLALVVESSDRVRSAFGDSAWQRLVELKRQWDPDNVFRLNHNIPPA
jgi:FAD/FMN-containing dehydrogenase